MMRQMRENTKWIMLVTALAFVALMVFEWGMDISGRSAGGLGEIGRVNGTPVMYEDYMAAYRNLYDRIQSSREEPITSQENLEIEDAAWDRVVNQILIQQELERRGIDVSDEEIRNAARFNPPPEFRQLPIFQTEGRFDLQKYQTYLASPQADQQILLYLEDYFREAIPQGKLVRQLATGVYLTDQELWRRWRAEHETVQVRYVPLNPDQRIADEEVPVGEGEIEEYYDENQEDFEVPARARVKAVSLAKTPTPEDTVASRERASEIRQEILDGADFTEVARRESADEQTAENGGELGVFAKGQMLETIDSLVFSAEVGTVSEPVQTPRGFHLVQVQERWDQDSASVRHILVPVQRTDDSELRLLTMADSLEDLGESLPLAEAADTMELEIQETEITEDFPFVPGVGQAREGADWAFREASVGDVSPVFENDQAFYSLELVSQTPGGILPLEEARSTIVQRLRQQKKMERAMEQARELVEEVRSGTALANAAADRDLEVRVTDPFARNGFVPGLGRQNAAIGAAFGLSQDQVSDPVKTSNNVFVLEQVSRTPADSAQWLQQKDNQRARIVDQLKSQKLERWLAGLRENSRIVDNRDAVLQAPDEEAPLGGGSTPMGLGF